jgi:hypothetical protein
VRYADGGAVREARAEIATARFTTIRMMADDPDREGKTVFAREDGTLFRMLPPGVWMVLITAPGHPGVVRSFTLTEEAPTAAFDIVMERIIIRQ